MKEVLYYHIVLEPVDDGKLLKSIHQLVSKNYVANAYLSLYVCMLIDKNFLTITILWYMVQLNYNFTHAPEQFACTC